MSLDEGRSDTHGVDVLRSVGDLVEIAGRLAPSTAVMAGGERIADLRLLESARDHGIIDRIILVGNEKRISASVAEVGIEVAAKDIVPADSDEQAAAATVEVVRTGEVNMVLKGSVSTPLLHRHMLPLAERATVSLVSVFDAAPLADGRPMIVTDAGVTTVCSFGRMVDLIRNAVDVAQTVMGIDRPRVAVLSANEKPIATLPSSWMGAALANRDWSDAFVYGPLSLDLATDPRAVAMKGLPDLPGVQEVAGRADILVCPGIDSANVAYKMVSAMIKHGEASLGNFIVGFPMSYVLLSRSDALETRLNSVALGSVYAQRRSTRRPRRPSPTVSEDATTYRVLVINPGSTSTKIAVFDNDRCVRDAEVAYAAQAGGTAPERRKQAERLTQTVRGVLDQGDWRNVDAVAARGGFVPRPAGKLPGGAYVVAELRDGEIFVDEALVSAVLDHPERDHASNFGIPVAAAFARELGVPAFVVDPVVVDEFVPEAEISGFAPVTRRSTSHALSVHAAARKAARVIGRPLDDINLVVAHLGGGITVAAVRQGRMIDNNISLLGTGPFSPQRAGQLPSGELIDLCYSGQFTRGELIAELTQRGGLQSYLGEHRMEVIEKRIAGGDERAGLVVDAMVYQIAKEIGAMFVAAGCDVEAIVLTGGLVRSKHIRRELRRRVGHLAPVMVFEESLEMGALADGAIGVLMGRDVPKGFEHERI